MEKGRERDECQWEGSCVQHGGIEHGHTLIDCRPSQPSLNVPRRHLGLYKTPARPSVAAIGQFLFVLLKGMLISTGAGFYNTFPPLSSPILQRQPYFQNIAYSCVYYNM